MNQLLRPGFKFWNGNLIVSKSDEVTIIESWPSLKAIRKSADCKAWSKFFPVFRLLRPRFAAPESDSLGPERVPSLALDPLFRKAIGIRHFTSSVPPEITISRQTATLTKR